MGPSRLARVGALIFLSLALLAPAPAAAADKAAARALATEGKNAYQAGKYEEAIEFLKKAERQYHAPTHQYLMALSHEGLKQYVEALELHYSIVNESLPENASQVLHDTQDRAAEKIKELEPRIAKLVVEVEPADLDEIKVVVNEHALSADLLGVPRRSNPGKKTIEVSAPGYETQTRQVELEEGGEERLTIRMVRSSGDAAEASVSGASTAVQDGDHSPNRTLAYGAFGIGVVGVGSGAAFLAMGLSDSKKADRLLSEECNVSGVGTALCLEETANEVEDLDKGAATKTTASIIGFSVGAAAVATGVVLWVLGSDKNPEVAWGRSLKARPYATPLHRGASLGLSGHF